MSGDDFHIYTVEEITLYIKRKLSSDAQLSDIWITGEISNFVSHSSGHFYFTLKDEGAQLPCAMFRWANESLKFELSDGMKLIAKGRIDVYKPQGRYNFVISEVHPKGMGELYLKYIQLKDRLAAEGLFDVEHKKPVPPYPVRIGVVTSPTGAALQDIINITGRRFPYSDILVVPTQVQGELAAQAIADSIRDLNALGTVDVAIVGRGGGSIEDLWPFNEEVVARAIFDSGIPIISAVGHETDFTIADFVADLRAPTPSAAAELVVPHRNELARHLAAAEETMLRRMQGMLNLQREHMVSLSGTLKPNLLMEKVYSSQQNADNLATRIQKQMGHILDLRRERFAALNDMLDAVSPLATLKRGYSITLTHPGEVVIDRVSKARKGEDIKIIVSDGEIRCAVQSSTGRDIFEYGKDGKSGNKSTNNEERRGG